MTFQVWISPVLLKELSSLKSSGIRGQHHYWCSVVAIYNWFRSARISIRTMRNDLLPRNAAEDTAFEPAEYV